MSDAKVTRAPRRGMIALRGDLASEALREICTAVAGVDFPDPMGARVEGERGLCWMSPDEILVLMPHAHVLQVVGQIDSALKGTHFMAENVSDARALFVVEDRHCREIIAKNAPVDLHSDAFGPGQMRRTRLGQVAAAFWMRDATTFQVICFASVADYVQELLDVSAARGPVGYF